jgi:hypothetical protein
MLMLGLRVISVRKSIFENPVYIRLYLGCRNKTKVGHLLLIGLGLALEVHLC